MQVLRVNNQSQQLICVRQACTSCISCRDAAGLSATMEEPPVLVKNAIIKSNSARVLAGQKGWC